MSDLVGKNLGKYQILECIGHGGMAEVYRAFQPGLDRVVAIKVVHSFLSRDENFLGRFRREAQAVADLRHANIVQVYDFDVYFDRPFMVLEYIDGVTLGSIIDVRIEQQRTLETSEVLWLMEGLCSAVAYAHRQGIVHRDITPANVMITSDGRVILTDFGLVRILGAMKFTATGQITGTPEYMSPEQAHGAPGDQRSDIYALGILLYESLTGRVPFTAETPVSVLLKHVSYPVTPVREINPDIPEPFETIVAKALAKDPDKRYQTGEELWTALESAISETPTLPQQGEAASLRPGEKRMTTMKRITPVPLPSSQPPLERKEQQHAPGTDLPRLTKPSPAEGADRSHPNNPRPSSANELSSPSPTLVSTTSNSEGTSAAHRNQTGGGPDTLPTETSPTVTAQQAAVGAPPGASATNSPLFSIEQVGVLASQILKSIETKDSGIYDTASGTRISRASHPTFAGSSVVAVPEESVAARVKKGVLFFAAACAIVTAGVIGSAALFQQFTGESPLAFIHSLSEATGTFEPKTFSLRKVLPGSFALAALLLFGFSAPGFIFGACFRAFTRALDFYLNVLGYLFVCSLALFSYNAFSVFQSVPVPALQFALAGTASFRQLSAIGSFNPVVTTLHTERFTGELKQTVLKASEDKQLSEALMQRAIQECLRPDLATNSYVGAWTLGYILVLSITIGTSISSSQKTRIFFSLIFAGLLTFLFLISQAAVSQKTLLREVDAGHLPLLVSEDAIPSMRLFWTALVLGTFICGVFAQPATKQRRAAKANVSVEVNIPD